MTVRRRTGIIGGTFDPIHIGHLHIALCARYELDLDEVVFMPAGSPPHKPEIPITSGASRLEMIEVAIRHLPGFASSDLDLRADSPSYTSQLLEAFRGLHPNSDLWFIIGSDSLHEFPTWHQPHAILQQARLGVALRPGWPVEALPDHPSLPSIHDSVDVFSSVPIDLSSTMIRTRIRGGLPVDWLVTPDVLEIIERNGIYRHRRGG